MLASDWKYKRGRKVSNDWSGLRQGALSQIETMSHFEALPLADSRLNFTEKAADEATVWVTLNPSDGKGCISEEATQTGREREKNPPRRPGPDRVRAG